MLGRIVMSIITDAAVPVGPWSHPPVLGLWANPSIIKIITTATYQVHPKPQLLEVEYSLYLYV